MWGTLHKVGYALLPVSHQERDSPTGITALPPLAPTADWGSSGGHCPECGQEPIRSGTVICGAQDRPYGIDHISGRKVARGPAMQRITRLIVPKCDLFAA